MHILVDFDGTLANLLNAMLIIENKRRRPEERLIETDIDHWDHWLFKDFFERLVDVSFQEELYGVLRPIPGARKYMPLIHAKNTIEILSVRPEASREATKEWLNKFRIPFDKMTFVDHSSEKVKVPGDLLIDDRPQTGQQFHAANRRFILVDEGGQTKKLVDAIKADEKYDDLLIAPDWRTIYSYVSLMQS